MCCPVDAVGITGQLMVTVEVFVQVDSLPQQRVAVLRRADAIPARQDTGLTSVTVHLHRLVA